MAITETHTDLEYGERPMSREWHWHPDLPIPTSPVFAWPPRPVAALRWLASYWLTISMTVIEVATACLVWYVLQPAPERTGTFTFDWIALMYLRNLALVFIVAGGLHLYLYTFRCQRDVRRFEALNPLASHSGFQGLMVGAKQHMKLGDFFH